MTGVDVPEVGAGDGVSQTAPHAQVRGCPSPTPAGEAGSEGTVGSADDPEPDFVGCLALHCELRCKEKSVSGRTKKCFQ